MANAPKPNAFFRFCGHPLCMVLTLTALFLWCMLRVPLYEYLWFLSFSLLFLVACAFVCSFISMLVCRKIVMALVSLVLFSGIFLASSHLSDWYEGVRFRLLEPQMRAVAEYVIAAPEVPKEIGAYTCALPWYFGYLSRTCTLHIDRRFPINGTYAGSVSFAQRTSPRGIYYYVYQNAGNPTWRIEYQSSIDEAY